METAANYSQRKSFPVSSVNLCDQLLCQLRACYQGGRRAENTGNNVICNFLDNSRRTCS